MFCLHLICCLSDLKDEELQSLRMKSCNSLIKGMFKEANPPLKTTPCIKDVKDPNKLVTPK